MDLQDALFYVGRAARFDMPSNIKAYAINDEAMATIRENMPDALSSSSTSKYFFTELTVVYGEYEDNSVNLIEAEADLTEEQLHDIARFERGSSKDDWDETCNFYWFDGYAVKLPDTIKPITKAEYDLMSQYLHATHIDNITEQVNA